MWQEGGGKENLEKKTKGTRKVKRKEVEEEEMPAMKFL